MIATGIHCSYSHQEILEYNCHFAIHTLQSLLYGLSDLTKLRHGFIEPLCVLAPNNPEHSCGASTFP